MNAALLLDAGGLAKTNGELLSLAESEFDVLLTLDKNVPYQQSLKSTHIAIVIVSARSNRIQDLLPVIPDCLVALRSIQPGQLVRVGNPSHR